VNTTPAGLRVEGSPAVCRLLDKHPRVADAKAQTGGAALRWNQNGWERSVWVGRPEVELKGLVELADNNPLVCADVFSVPGAAATLALIALGPLASAGLIVERPAMMISIEADEAEVSPYLESVGWHEGLTVASQEIDFAGAVAATVMCVVATPERLGDLDDLYDERFARSFFVRRDETSEWDAALVVGKPHAVFRLQVSPDAPDSLLRIQVMADREGKCGAAQVVHAMNVMCGFEESLGLGVL